MAALLRWLQGFTVLTSMHTNQVIHDLLNPCLDPINALPGSLQRHFVRIGSRTREADDHIPILLRYLLDQLKIAKNHIFPLTPCPQGGSISCHLKRETPGYSHSHGNPFLTPSSHAAKITPPLLLHTLLFLWRASILSKHPSSLTPFSSCWEA